MIVTLRFLDRRDSFPLGATYAELPDRMHPSLDESDHDDAKRASELICVARTRCPPNAEVDEVDDFDTRTLEVIVWCYVPPGSKPSP